MQRSRRPWQAPRHWAENRAATVSGRPEQANGTGWTRRATSLQRPDALPLLVLMGLLALVMTTVLQSYLGISREDDAPAFAALRLLTIPAVLAVWSVACWRAGRRFAWSLDIPSLLPLWMVAWFTLSSMLSDEPVGGLARAFALFAMVWGGVAVLGPALIRRDGGRSLLRVCFGACAIAVSLSALASVSGHDRGWGLFDQRYRGPLSSTQFGPLCVAGLLAGIALWTIERPGWRRTGIVAVLLLLLVLLVLSRARGSYVAGLAGLLSLLGLAAYRRSVAHLAVAGVCAVVVLGGASLVLRQGLGDGEAARFLRLDNAGMLNQRLEVWGANAGFWQEFPLFGVGLGREAALSELSKRSHSAYLSTVNEGGLPALLLLVATLGVATWRLGSLAASGSTPQARAVGSLGLSAVVAAGSLGLVETTLINAASAFNCLVWLCIGAGAFAARVDAAARVGSGADPRRGRLPRPRVSRHRPLPRLPTRAAVAVAVCMLGIGTVAGAETGGDRTQCLAHALELLQPLRKVHYSWPLGAVWLNADSAVLRELARVTGAVSLSGETATAEQVDAVVQAAKRVGERTGGRPVVIGINYSPWHRRFGKALPATDTGVTAAAELALFDERLEAIRVALRDANARYGAAIDVGALLLDSERFVAAPDRPGLTEAIVRKYDQIYDIAKRRFPAAAVHWYGRGMFRLRGDGVRWDMVPYFTMLEKGDSVTCQIYEVPQAERMRQACRRSVDLARQQGDLAVTAWVALGAGYERLGRRSHWEFNRDYDRRESWALGRSLSGPPGDSPEGPWIAVDTVVLYPSPLDDRSPLTFEHFLAYARGAAGEADTAITGLRGCGESRAG